MGGHTEGTSSIRSCCSSARGLSLDTVWPLCPIPLSTQVVSSHVLQLSFKGTFFPRQPSRKLNLFRVSLKTTGAQQFAAKYFGLPIILTQPKVRTKHFLLKHLWNGWSAVFNSHLEFWNPWAVEATTLKWKMPLASCWSPSNFKQVGIIVNAVEASQVLQEKDSFGQFCTVSEMACGAPCGHETEERKTMLLCWGCMRKRNGCFWQSHSCTRHLWMFSAPKPPDQISSTPLSRTWWLQSYLGSL